ncbi:MAG TPA: hypothetical protein P5308_10650 [Syntrophales bacterium]|nr:hypothetical protein [Syntrophales bacterium]
MVTLSDLEREKENILSKIAAAAVVGSSDVVLAECVKLKEIEKLIEEEKRIVSKFNRIKDATASPPDSGGKKKYISKPLPKPPGKTSATQIATSIRHAFLNKLEGEGIRLRPIEGRTLYRTSSGKKVGIAVATERLPDRWFLGLNAGTFDHAVLLCDRNGETEEILLPELFQGIRPFFESIWRTIQVQRCPQGRRDVRTGSLYGRRECLEFSPKL